MKFLIGEESGAQQLIEASSIDVAISKAKRWAAEVQYDRRQLVYLDVQTLVKGKPVGESVTIEVEVGPLPKPAKTECGEADADHDWQQPFEVVGGIVENPGCWLTGGTSSREDYVCAVCGQHKSIRYAGELRDPGHLPVEIEYKDATPKALEWLDTVRQ